MLVLTGLLEERAVILGRQGSHEKALAIYIYKLKNPHKAEEYCVRVSAECPKQNKNVSGEVVMLLWVLRCPV